MFKLSFAIICYLASSVAAVQDDYVYFAVRRNCDQSDSPTIQGCSGTKGESGVCNVSDILKLTNQVNNLTEQLANSRQQMNILETSIDRLNQENVNLFERLNNLPSPGWYTPWNGYQYKLTTTRKNWQNSRTACQAMGGDLAVYGIKDHNTTKQIGKAIIQDHQTWIGLNDIASEGRFAWVDGTAFNSSALLWQNGEPNNARGVEDCADIVKGDQFKLNDSVCTNLFFGLCEKLNR